MLARARVLIVEDEAIIAMSLAGIVEDADGCVVACCETVSAAVAALETAAPDIAVLDFHLTDGEVTPLAEQLLDRGVPIVLHTASPVPRRLLAQAPRLVVCPKPSSPRLLTDMLDAQLALGAPDARLS